VEKSRFKAGALVGLMLALAACSPLYAIGTGKTFGEMPVREIKENSVTPASPAPKADALRPSQKETEVTHPRPLRHHRWKRLVAPEMTHRARHGDGQWDRAVTIHLSEHFNGLLRRFFRSRQSPST